MSLGLLGALSIVRFRTPIKEPEEIGFLMVVIATSLAISEDTVKQHLKSLYEKLGAETMRGGPDEMRAFQNAEIQLWKNIAAKAKVEQQ